MTASFGAVLLPDEAWSSSGALRLADQRLYAQKRVAHDSPGRQTHHALLRVLFEREPVGERIVAAAPALKTGLPG